MYRFFTYAILILLALSCEDKKLSGYRICNNILRCGGSENGEFCTFGYKWGAGNPFPNAGVSKPGPALGPVEISFTFIGAGQVFSTHSQDKLISQSFDDLPACSRDTIRLALSRWEAVAAISFIEKNDLSGNIKFIMSDIKQGGVAFPPFNDKPCSDLAGQVAINFNPNRTCQGLYILALHEIGHALGLGHVPSDNVMNPAKAYINLQAGDIEGVQSIYGKK